MIKDDLFEELLLPNHQIAFDCLKAVIKNCLGVHRSENWRGLIFDMLHSFDEINVRMSLKIHFLHHHLDHFEKQIPTESDEHGEKFHQITIPMESWFSGKKIDSLLADICWNLFEEAEDDD